MPVQYSASPAVAADRSLLSAMVSGFRLRCPACREGRMFRAYLKVADRCPSCGSELHHHRADDAPPYFVMMIVGHIVVPLVLMIEVAYGLPLWVHAAIWLPLTLLLALLLLPRVKGAIVALQWALRLHGFGDATAADRLAAYASPSDRAPDSP